MGINTSRFVQFKQNRSYYCYIHFHFASTMYPPSQSPTPDTRCDDVVCIQQQCGITLEKAIEQYNKCSGDVVLAISSYFGDISHTTATEPTKMDATQLALHDLRKIANEKDGILNQILHKQKQPHHTHLHQHTQPHQHYDQVYIEELGESEEPEGDVPKLPCNTTE